MFLGSSGNNRWEWRKNFMSFCLSFWRLLTSTMLLFWTKLNVRVRVITQNCCCRFFFFFLTTKTLTQFEISGIFLHCRKSILKPWFSSNLDSMRSQLANSNTIQTFRNQFELSCVLCVEMRWVNKKLTEIQIQSKIFPRCLELEETDSKIRNFSTWNVNKNKLGNVCPLCCRFSCFFVESIRMNFPPLCAPPRLFRFSTSTRRDAVNWEYCDKW